ncbi:MAG TPA: hypothetical protein PKC21_08980 [Oligoflexia bacterium]|nr:hypothetical protein [Oligoflexia bacterium]HMR25473.1 hypothetical protein [Oligoflexia bacterium]
MAFFLKNKILLIYYLTLFFFLFYVAQSTFLFNFDYEFFFVLNLFSSFHILILQARRVGKASIKHILIGYLLAVFTCFIVNQVNQSICNLNDSLYWLTVQGLSALLVNVALFKLCQYLFIYKTFKRLLLHCFFIILLSLPVVYDLIAGPQLSFYHILFGYYHGPIYDAYIPKPSSFLWFRLWSSGLALIIIYFFSYKNARLFTQKFKRSFTIFLIGLFIIPLTLRHHLNWVKNFTDIKQNLTQHIGLGPVHLYYSPTTYTPNQAKVLLKSLHFEYMFLAKELNFTKQALSPVNVYIYPDPYIKKDLTGTGLTLIGNAMQNSIHALPTQASNSILRHELAHIILRPYGFYGLSTSPALIEGFATSFEYERHGLSVHEWSKIIAQKKLTPSLQSLFSPTSFWSANSYISYLYTGSFMHWLLHNFEKEKVLASYASGNFQKHLKLPLAQLEHQWLNFLQTITISEDAREKAMAFLQQKPITQIKCPHQLACVKKQQLNCPTFDCKVNTQEKLVQYSKGEQPNLQLQLLTYYLAQEQLDSAQSLIKKLSFENLNRMQHNYLDLLQADFYTLNDSPKASEVALLTLEKQLKDSAQNSFNTFLLTLHIQFRLNNLESPTLKNWLQRYYQTNRLSDLPWDELKVSSIYNLALIYQKNDYSSFTQHSTQLNQILAASRNLPDQQHLLLKLQAEASEYFEDWNSAQMAYSKLLKNHAHTEGERFYYQHQLNRIKSLRY